MPFLKLKTVYGNFFQTFLIHKIVSMVENLIQWKDLSNYVKKLFTE